MFGVARGAQLVPLRVHRTVSQFDTRNLNHAIREVAAGKIEGKPQLISIAMGGPPTLSMYRAVRQAEKNGVLVVAAAGNYVRTVVWPARFKSTIAAAAINVRCHPWKHSSRGRAVDISAPGESVWRATLNEDRQYINYMGKGTTFATGNTAGAAALWLAHHQDTRQLKALQQAGLVTKAFRHALQQSAWQPSSDMSQNPDGTHCDQYSWNEDDYGPGILDINALLDVPLMTSASRALADPVLDTIPLFASIYPEETPAEQIHDDYKALLKAKSETSLNEISKFETEIMYHYTVSEDVQRTIDNLVRGQRGDESSNRAREMLLNQDLSSRLRQRLTNN